MAWALERFELGLERDDPLSGLTDNLLALRALLEPEGPRGAVASLGRIAAALRRAAGARSRRPSASRASSRSSSR